jgi:sugar (pentulose or hexulose) kinase
MKLNCCLIFDIGKTNQKYFVFDKNHKILSRAKITISKIKDEDGHTAEDIKAIVSWMKASFKTLLSSKKISN